MAIKYAKENPELLIIENAGDDDRAEVWRLLRQNYDMATAIETYQELFPDTVREIARNEGGSALSELPQEILDRPDFQEAVERFRQFHGRDPDNFQFVTLGDGDAEGLEIGFVMGEAPAVSYDANEVVRGSSKEGAVYVHPFESEDGERPLVVSTSDGKFIGIMQVNAKGEMSGFSVSDWVRG